MLKGQWLKELGFEIGDYISVSCENGKLVITPDAERAALVEAEALFMEQETKKLQKRFEAEKAEISLLLYFRQMNRILLFIINHTIYRDLRQPRRSLSFFQEGSSSLVGLL